MKPSIGISDPNRQSVVKILNALLADEYVLYTKTRNYHWNVVGPQFNDLHKFFESQYEALNDIVDDVAERSRALGGNAAGTLASTRRPTPCSRTSSPTTRRSSRACGATFPR